MKLLKVLFYGDQCKEALALFPVMDALKRYKNILTTFGSVTHEETITLAIRNGFSITRYLYDFDILVVCIIHRGVNLDLCRSYYNSGKPVILIQWALDHYANLFSELRPTPINYFTHMCVAGPKDLKIMKTKFKEKVRMTGMPRFDKLSEAKNWDKSKIYDLVGTNKYWLVTIPHEAFGDKIEYLYFSELPKLVRDKLVYKIHPTRLADRYRKYGQILIDDDTKSVDMTYELINASQGVITHIPPSFMVVEASILKKPVFCYGELPRTASENIGWRLKYLEKSLPLLKERIDPSKITSTFDKPAFNKYQQTLADEFLHDGKNSQRVAEVILDIGKEIGKY